MENGKNENWIMKIFDWCYDQASDSGEQLAKDYLSKHETEDKAINAMLKMQNLKAITSGFLTGLGGALTLPVSVPANLLSITYIQMTMIAAVAGIRGYDLKSDQVKTLVFMTLTGKQIMDIVKECGIKVSQRLATNYILHKLPKDILNKINKLVGFKLITKAGEKGAVSLVKVVPLLGGVVGGVIDGGCTYAVGKTAKNIFQRRPDTGFST
jgi:uncharacterized protein (DUF697 family)